MTEVLMPYADAAAAGACEAGTRRWLERAVIGLNLCPFAKAVYNKKQIRFAVTAARSADELLAELAHELELLVQSDPQELDTTLLIHPLVMNEFIDYHFFLGEAGLSEFSCVWHNMMFIRSMYVTQDEDCHGGSDAAADTSSTA